MQTITKSERVNTVVAGEEIELHGYCSVGRADERESDVWRGTVQPACSQDRGHWYCVTHRKGFVNDPIGKDIHIRQRGKHRMAWICWNHGPEQP